jgi:hydrogen peroxide-dependent heme synthase
MMKTAPHTLYGWYALHEMFTIDHDRVQPLDAAARASLAHDAEMKANAGNAGDGWTSIYELVGGGADLMVVHFRPSFDALVAARRAIRQAQAASLLRPVYDFVSVAEAALYEASVDALSTAPAGTPAHATRLEELTAAELGSPRLRQRLQPPPPDDWRYVCFYPMNRRRTGSENWYALDMDERGRLLREHGLTGRRYAGRILQIITGSTGLSDWEWGVTLFARDPLELKRIVTDMRYDEASARYAEFGRCFTGVRAERGGWL